MAILAAEVTQHGPFGHPISAYGSFAGKAAFTPATIKKKVELTGQFDTTVELTGQFDTTVELSSTVMDTTQDD